MRSPPLKSRLRDAAVLAAGLAVALLAAAPAAAAAGPVWVVPGGEKVFPSTAPGEATAISLQAAANELEAAQVAVSLPAPATVTLAWSADSDPLLTANTEVFRVGYVTVTQPSTGAGSRRGPYPDPLLPAKFGQSVDLPAGTTAFYVRVHVPADAPTGDYLGTLVVNGAAPVPFQVPVSLHVWDFGWTRPSVHTAFAMSVASVMKSVAGVVEETPENEARLSDTYYRFFADHWINVTSLRPRPEIDRDTGVLDTTGLAQRFGPYLGLPGVDDGLFWDSAYPLSGGQPWGDLDPVAQRPQLETAARDVLSFYRAHGWDRRSYFYVYDEPSLASELKAEKFAEVVHEVSDDLGFRARVMLTDWPRPKAIGGRAANAFLFDDVDIWCPSMYRYFLALPALADRRAEGSEVWWYSYASQGIGRYPTFLIDESLTEERAFAWMTWRYDASGILYWGTTRWGDPVTGKGYRNPYLDPLSYGGRRDWYANGEASLIYPGYEPSLGLTDPWAPPVSSLRLESLRDGIEDYEYLRLASRSRLDGEAGMAAASCARAVSAAIAEYPYGAHPFGYRNVPGFSGDPKLYQAARAHLADYIERAQDGVAPARLEGSVTDALSGAPLVAATVSDGVVSTMTDASGRFSLDGVVSPCLLTVSHPLYASAQVEAREGDPPLAVALTGLTSARRLASFESRAHFRVRNGYSALSDAWATSGTYSAKLVLRGSLSTATLSLPPRSRDLRHDTRLELDVFNPSTIDHAKQWFLHLTAVDRRGRTITQRFLLRPEGLTHLSLPLRRRSFDRRHVTEIVLSTQPTGAHTVLVDSLAVR